MICVFSSMYLETSEIEDVEKMFSCISFTFELSKNFSEVLCKMLQM